jgi:hypothetical protein
MIDSFRDNVLFSDATDKDAEELDRMRERYQEAGGWQEGTEAAIGEFIMRVAHDGVPGGDYLISQDRIDLYTLRGDLTFIERPY